MACNKICSKCGETGLGCTCGGCKPAYNYNGSVYCKKCFNEVANTDTKTDNQAGYTVRITSATATIETKK